MGEPTTHTEKYLVKIEVFLGLGFLELKTGGFKSNSSTMFWLAA
jgi:hypothetical protein